MPTSSETGAGAVSWWFHEEHASVRCMVVSPGTWKRSFYGDFARGMNSQFKPLSPPSKPYRPLMPKLNAVEGPQSALGNSFFSGHWERGCFQYVTSLNDLVAFDVVDKMGSEGIWTARAMNIFQ